MPLILAIAILDIISPGVGLGAITPLYLLLLRRFQCHQCLGFLVNRRHAPFFERNHVLPVILLTRAQNRFTGVKTIGHDGDRQFGKVLLDPRCDAIKSAAFTILFIHLGAVFVLQKFCHERKYHPAIENQQTFEHINTVKRAIFAHLAMLTALIQRIITDQLLCAIDCDQIPFPDQVVAEFLSSDQVPKPLDALFFNFLRGDTFQQSGQGIRMRQALQLWQNNTEVFTQDHIAQFTVGLTA